MCLFERGGSVRGDGEGGGSYEAAGQRAKEREGQRVCMGTVGGCDHVVLGHFTAACCVHLCRCVIVSAWLCVRLCASVYACCCWEPFAYCLYCWVPLTVSLRCMLCFACYYSVNVK